MVADQNLQSDKDKDFFPPDPNLGLTTAELRLGKRVQFKVSRKHQKMQNLWNVRFEVATEEEKKDEKVLLGNIYNDKVAKTFIMVTF